MTALEYSSTSTTEHEAGNLSGHWLGWAAYLAASWTWCIGLFLPMLLVRDFGLWAWVVFAIPNVLGAAALGWVLTTRQLSTAIMDAHHIAAVAFSVVTAAFQIFAAGWILDGLGFGLGVLAMLCISIAVGFVSMFWRTGGLLSGVVTMLLSLVCIVTIIVVSGLFGLRSSNFTDMHHPFEPDLLFLTPVIVFGFLFCPHLDRTLHAARQRMDARASRWAFGMGFGIFFLGLICFSLVYAMFGAFWFGEDVIPWLLAMYFGVQLSFTTGVHWSGGNPIHGRERWHVVAIAAASTVLGLLALGLSGLMEDGVFPVPLLRDMEAGELLYRCFMGFYGLVFPAYVWLCMVPSPRAVPTGRMVMVFAVTTAVAAPMFWLGFIHGKMLWLLPGLALVLLVRLAIRRNPAA